jgi:hypothetical protein
MPQVANVVLNDDESVPVAHTFGPTADVDGVQVAHDRSSGVPIGFPVLKRQLKIPSLARAGQNSGNRVYRCKLNLSIPALETLGTADSGLTPPPTKAFDDHVTIEFVTSERSNLQNRKNLLAMSKDLLNHADTTAMVVNQENLRG